MSNESAQRLLESGLEAHRRGDLAEARDFYDAVLERDPSNADAYHLLGLVALSAKMPDAAAELIAHAITLRDSVPFFHNNLANARKALGDMDGAMRAYFRAIELQPDYVEAYLNLGLTLKESNRRDEAIEAWKSAMIVDSTVVDVLVNLGMALYERGDLPEAATLMERAVAQQPQDAGLAYYLGLIYLGLGRHAEALPKLEQATQTGTAVAEAYHNLGLALQGLGRHAEAVESYRTALQLDPDLAASRNNLSVALQACGELDAAEAMIRDALLNDPQNIDLLLNLGNLYEQRGQTEAAIEYYQQVLDIDPTAARAHSNLSAVLHQRGQLEDALTHAELATDLESKYASGWCNLGNILLDLGDARAGKKAIEKALRLRPQYVEGWNNLGNALMQLGDVAASRDAYERALTLAPQTASAHWNHALALLKLGDLQAGFNEYEWRWQGCPSMIGHFRHPPQQLWQGQPLAGKTLLLWAEQGLGDTLQFIRYAPLLAAQGARVILECPPPLLNLLRSVPGLADLVPVGGAVAYDLHCPLLSVPQRCQTTLDSIPNQTPYFSAPADRQHYWQNRLGDVIGRKVGLVWAGNPRPNDPAAAAVDRRRSVPFAELQQLGLVPNTTFVSLQKGQAEVQCADWAGPAPLLNWMAEISDFADTAALAANLDLIITVDTSVAHLAGGLGKPVWLLSRLDGCWRWLLDRNDSPWYPQTRLFRQEVSGEWATVIADICAALQTDLP